MRQGRRLFLIELAAALGAPVVIAACKRGRSESSSKSRGVELQATVNLDEPPNAASFRPALPASEPVLRVRVLKVRDSASALRIGSQGEWLHLHGPAASGKGVAVIGPVVALMTGEGWSLLDGAGLRAAVHGREPLNISRLDDEEQAASNADELIAVSYGDAAPRAYPGSLRLVSRHDLAPETSSRVSSAPGDAKLEAGARGLFDLISNVPLETYLPGVLAGELYRHWQPETYAAQAVAARSFAATEAAVFARARHYDLTNTASSQMYLGSVTHDRAHGAVRLTRGLVLAYENLLVSGYYSSCCGGVAASARDAIGSNPVNDVPPLRGRAGSDVCTEALVYAWSVQRSVDDFTGRLLAYRTARGARDAETFGAVAAIEAAQTNEHGRPVRMRIIDSAGAMIELSAEELRRAANYSNDKLLPPAKELRSSNVHANLAGESITFEGRGFGHGVGLCQWGAEALAKGGMPHEDILRWYYPEVELIRAYG